MNDCLFILSLHNARVQLDFLLESAAAFVLSSVEVLPL